MGGDLCVWTHRHCGGIVRTESRSCHVRGDAAYLGVRSHHVYFSLLRGVLNNTDPVPVPQGRGRATELVDGHTGYYSDDGAVIDGYTVSAVCLGALGR